MDDVTEDRKARADEQAPTLRQRLHAATGDRDAEAQALADESGGSVDDAKVAVLRSHGEAGAGQPRPVTSHPDEELAEASDVDAVRREQADGGA